MDEFNQSNIPTANDVLGVELNDAAKTKIKV